MHDIDKIRQLIEMMVANDLVEISLRDGEEEVSLRRPNPIGTPVVSSPGGPLLAGPLMGDPAPLASLPPVEAEPEADGVDLDLIEAPMVGTFYSASDPEAPPFVKVGDQIQAGTVVCILEAMKVFNEIKAELAGTIEKIFVKNADAVEFGQPMFAIRPA